MTTRAQGHRDVVLNVLPFRGISINDATANTASVTVYASDSGILFINEYQSTTTYTLPVVADCKGKWFGFYSNYASDLAITGGTAALLSGGNASAAVDSDTVTLGGVVGGWCIIVGDGSNYFCLAGTGTWTGST